MLRMKHIVMLGCCCLSVPAMAADLHVPGQYPDVASALAAVQSGDTIRIAAGTYTETGLVFPAPNCADFEFNIIGETDADGNPAVNIDGSAGGTWLTAEAHGYECATSCQVELHGLHFTGFGVPGGWGDPVLKGSAHAIDWSSSSEARFDVIACSFTDNQEIFWMFAGDYSDTQVLLVNCRLENNQGPVHNMINEESRLILSNCWMCGTGELGDFSDIEWPGTTILPECLEEIATGACCVASGCTQLEDAACAAVGGTWLGEATACDDCPASCAGDTNSDGSIDITDLLNMLGGWGACP